LKQFDAVIVAVPNSKSIILDKTAIYPRGGGQPSDHGWIKVESTDGSPNFEVTEASKSPEGVVHVLSSEIPDGLTGQLTGNQVHGLVDWDLRYKHMRHHTALHILSGVVYHKYSARITGGQIYSDRARLDLSLDDLSKERKSEIEAEMNRIVSENLDVTVDCRRGFEETRTIQIKRRSPSKGSGTS
jgi:misacylated tRNA(Ala) deacylase